MHPLFAKSKQELLWQLDRYPSLFGLQMRLRASRHLAVTPESELCIEGFPRSGNTFAAAAFEHAQGRGVRVGRHVHSPGHVLRALDLGIPTMVVVRKPPDPILSLVVRQPAVSVAQATRAYVHFYERLLAVRDQVIVAPFDVVIDDFGTIIEALNRRFGTSFETFLGDTASRNAIRQRIEAMERDDSGADGIREHAVSRPSQERDAAKAQLLGAWHNASLASWRDRAERAHDQFYAGWTENKGHG
ncbi:MAG: hypothetical protein ACI8TX_003173 [Hyphomicrobiaceae bacterium]